MMSGLKIHTFAVSMVILALFVGSQTCLAASHEISTSYPPYHGPKKTIAVSKFDAHGAYVAKYGGWDIGGGLAAMLVNELVKTNRFIVVDRAELDAVLQEQQLAQDRLATAYVPKVGELFGAQMLVRGSVTEFDEDESGGGFSFGGTISKFVGAIGPRTRVGHVTVDLKLVDTTTSRVIRTYTADQKIKAQSIALEVGTDDVNFGGDAFNKSSLGKATRAAIHEAVGFIVAKMDHVPWQGLVAKVKGSKIYINAGQNANLKIGDQLDCCRIMEVITNPQTREVLGVEEEQIGRVEIIKIAPLYSVAVFRGRSRPKTGDIIRLTSY